ncbi:MAG: M15 family metallopeptidase [Steroidobacterales bacterium]
MHAHVAVPFMQLRRIAADAGFDLVPVSAFRDFERQLAIWNAKYAGTRPISGADGTPIDAAALAPEERVRAILQWSALPGASRHHWGTDLDLIDRAALPSGYRVRLECDEYAPRGPFAAATEWLDANAGRFGFFRPFRGVRSGVRPEPWHYSFAPTAEIARRDLQVAVLAAALAETPLLGKEAVLPQLEAIHSRYVDSIDLP